jgi:hypothetical protein
MLQIVSRQEYFVIKSPVIFDEWTLDKESLHPEGITIVTFGSSNRVVVDVKTIMT